MYFLELHIVLSSFTLISFASSNSCTVFNPGRVFVKVNVIKSQNQQARKDTIR